MKRSTSAIVAAAVLASVAALLLQRWSIHERHCARDGAAACRWPVRAGLSALSR